MPVVFLIISKWNFKFYVKMEINFRNTMHGSISSLFPEPKHIVSGEEERKVEEGIEHGTAVRTHERAPFIQHLLQRFVHFQSNDTISSLRCN